jgi:Ca2+-binding RTX toxin-like protein
MADVPIVVLAGQSNAVFGGIDNRVVERLTASGNAFEFAKVAVNGASLFASPNEDFDPATGELFTQLVDATKAAMANAVAQGQTPKVALLLVHGETDAGRPVATHTQKLTEFITEFRRQTGAPDAEVYLSLLSNPVPGRTSQLQAAATVPGVFTIETRGLNKWDASHYDHAGREHIANEFMDMSGLAAPNLPGYDNLLADTTIKVNANNVVEVTSALYLDLVFTGDDRTTSLNSFSGDDIVTTGAGNDIIRTGDNDDIIHSGAGNDIINAGSGDDYVEGGPGNDEINGFIGFDILYGGAGDDRLLGYLLDDYLNGGEGNDTLDGGAGVDVMEGGTGNDTYFVDDAADRVIELPDEGQDVVYTTVSFDLAGIAVETLRLSGNGSIAAYGNELANLLIGNGGNNILDGRTGADVMSGGGGDDIYFVDNVGDVVNEAAGAGIDTVWSSIDFSLGANVENLVLTGGYAATGNGLANSLIGNDLANLLDGGGGADTMSGGDGDDIYVVDEAGDVVVETADGGIDLVRSNIAYTLGAHVEQLALLGSSNISGIGNGLDNCIMGNSGNNTLIGGLGADTMIGYAGNDTYLVDNAQDVVIEAADGGIDLVRATVSYTLAANIERLTLDGSLNIAATGNLLDNLLTGNSGNNMLDGGLGADVMVGGDGDDVYYVDNAGDRAIESAGAGIDLVRSTISFTLGANVERLTLDGAANISATGNALANRLIGNSGNNTLIGGAGADYMAGGDGLDTYYVDDPGDEVVETQAGVIDLVHSTISYTLGENVERLTLSGVADIDGTGNHLDNRLTGNGGNNVLDAGSGRDVLVGGGGNDVFLFSSALEGQSLAEILDFTPGQDRIGLSGGRFGLSGAGGTLAASAFASGIAAGDADDRIIYDRTSGKLFYDADGAGAASQILFARVTAGTELGAGNFLVV